MGVPTVLVARTDADSRQAAHLATSTRATGPSSPASARPRASSRSRAASRPPSPAASPTRPTPTWSGARPRRPTSPRPSASPRASTRKFPGKLLAYNCSPSFNWKKHLDDATIAKFQRELGRHGLQVPVRHAGRLPLAEPRHVRAGARLRQARHGRLLGAAAARVRLRGVRLHRDPPPARGGHRATSTRWRRWSRAGWRRRWRWPSRPRPSSSDRRPSRIRTRHHRNPDAHGLVRGSGSEPARGSGQARPVLGRRGEPPPRSQPCKCRRRPTPSPSPVPIARP